MSREKLIHCFGFGLIGVAYLFSVVWVGKVMLENRQPAPEDTTGKRIIRLMHWQLEPGYREAMQEVMDAYNALPHVRQANVEVRQLDITERVYAQVLNVQLISGTAPDICEKGMGALAMGSGISQYFEALESYVNQPNPYNKPEYLPEGLSPALASILQHRPWRDTFIDGMQGGWDESLQNYYAVPTSVLGGLRIYYNRDMIAQVKQMLRQAARAEPGPQWYQDILLSPDGSRGYVTASAAFLTWLENDQPPRTMGQFFAISLGVRELARQKNQPSLVPVSGSGYSDMMFAERLQVPFTSRYASTLDFDQSQSVDGLETWLGWREGIWQFQDPAVRAYFECLRAISEQFPPGFVGLDREQARRRFINGQAAMIASGIWDARSIFDNAQGLPVTPEQPARPDEPVTMIDGVPMRNHRFRVGVTTFPLPATGERWGDVVSDQGNEARMSASGGPYAVSRQSHNKAWAVDFLQYLTSYTVNETFNRQSGWLPCIVGTSPQDQMMPFMPDPRGISPGDKLSFDQGSAAIRTRYQGQLKRYLSGDIAYPTFTDSLEDMVRNDRYGVDRIWHDTWANSQSSVRFYDRLLAVEAIRELYDLPDASPDKVRRPAYYSASIFGGARLQAIWRDVTQSQTFPEY